MLQKHTERVFFCAAFTSQHWCDVNAKFFWECIGWHPKSLQCEQTVTLYTLNKVKTKQKQYKQCSALKHLRCLTKLPGLVQLVAMANGPLYRVPARNSTSSFSMTTLSHSFRSSVVSLLCVCSVGLPMTSLPVAQRSTKGTLTAGFNLQGSCLTLITCNRKFCYCLDLQVTIFATDLQKIG